MGSTGGARAALRSVLRVLDAKVTPVNGDKMWRDYVISEFRKNAGEADPARARELVAIAEDYAFLARSVHGQKDLLMSYNIATDKRQQEHERLVHTAARVGLRLPPSYSGTDSNNKK